MKNAAGIAVKYLTSCTRGTAIYCRSESAPGGVPTKSLRAPRTFRMPVSSLTTIASRLAPTGISPPTESACIAEAASLTSQTNTPPHPSLHRASAPACSARYAG
ncbi:hypothetical protein CQZ98_10330 [Pseudomonas sp. MYb115]|nr:hypothetical protein CQZ98_10330 [Pseudomonas sp. MYb115]